MKLQSHKIIFAAAALSFAPLFANAADAVNVEKSPVAPSPAVTAADQSQRPQDVELTRVIREDLMKRDISMGAKNITIISRNGAVVIKGEVASQQEKNVILQAAKTHAGAANVKDEVAVLR